MTDSVGAIAYIIAEFPSRTETFIRREALFINESLPLYLIVLKKRRMRLDKVVAEAFGDRIIRMPAPLSSKVIVSCLRHGILRKYREQTDKSLIRMLTSGGIKESIHRIKTVLIGFYVSNRIARLPIRHIHAHFANYPAEVAAMVSRFSGLTYSFTAHANDIYVESPGLTDRIGQALFVATCTNYNKKRLDALVTPEERGKIYLIHHGVDLKSWRYTTHRFIGDTVRILTIGRLVEKKGIIYLPEAVRVLSEKGISVKLCIVGKGPEERRLKRYRREYGLEKSVTFVGWQSPDQIKQWYADSDIFVLPSVVALNGDRDGIPNVIFEAMAAGLPVISTPVSGIPEVIRSGYNGLLVPEKDVEQLARAVSDLMIDDDLRVALIQHARRTVEEEFDDERCNMLLKNIFENCMNGHDLRNSHTVLDDLAEATKEDNSRQFC